MGIFLGRGVTRLCWVGKWGVLKAKVTYSEVEARAPKELRRKCYTLFWNLRG